jgi:hypothetical protein
MPGLKGQITLEQTYDFSGTVTQLENDGYKYFFMDVVNSRCLLYNLDHSLWKTIDVSVPAEYWLYDMGYVSQKLFNTNDLIELSYICYYYDEAGQYYIYETRIADETGNILLTIPGGAFAEVVSAGAGGSKYIAYVWDYSVFPYTVQTKIYSIPGQLLSSGPAGTAPFQHRLDLYPNPATNSINVDYSLPGSASTGELQVIDQQGRTVRRYNVDNRWDHIIVETAGFAPGLYFCRLVTGSQAQEIKKFIIQ